MLEIVRLLEECGLGRRIVDYDLAWGAKASIYADAIACSIARYETPVLIELTDDLSKDFDRSLLIVVDHHGPAAGADRPCALAQIAQLVGPDRHREVWTRRRALVAANDIGHAAGMRALGADRDEIRAIRDADRAAQGVTAADEAEARRALAHPRRIDGLLLVETSAPTSSAVMDFLLPEYDGPGESDILVVTSQNLVFFGRGDVVQALSFEPGSWFGGALPEKGYWGIPRPRADKGALVRKIAELLEAPAR